MHILIVSITLFLSRAVVPTIQGYEDAGDFTVTERLRTSIRGNLVFYIIIGAIGLFGLILLIIMRRDWFALSLISTPFFFFSKNLCGPSISYYKVDQSILHCLQSLNLQDVVISLRLS